MTPAPDINPELASTDQLVEELRRRSELMFVVVQPLAQGTKEHAWQCMSGVHGAQPSNSEDDII